MELQFPDSVNPVVQKMENWLPGIGEPTYIHDLLHEHFGIGFSIEEEARLLGFQLGHSKEGSIWHGLCFCLMSLSLYPKEYRTNWPGILCFWEGFRKGKLWRGVPYFECPRGVI